MSHLATRWSADAAERPPAWTQRRGFPAPMDYLRRSSSEPGTLVYLRGSPSASPHTQTQQHHLNPRLDHPRSPCTHSIPSFPNPRPQAANRQPNKPKGPTPGKGVPLSMPGGNQTQPRAPVLSIQCDWNEVISKHNGEVWISCKFRGEKSLHGKIKNLGSVAQGDPKLMASEGFSVTGLTHNRIQVKHSDSSILYIFIAPVKNFSFIHAKSVVSLDVTPGELAVSVCTDNKMYIWDTNQGLVRRLLEGHMADVYRCRFFPSGIVVLSGGADMQLKIWSAETGQCPVTLRGHTAAVTDLCMVDRGRNIVSVSKDGKAKLWSCGEAKCLDDLVELPSAINTCCLVQPDCELPDPNEPLSKHEVGTSNKLLLLGCEDGNVAGVAVASRKRLFHRSLTSAVNCIVALSEQQFVIGCQNGQILLYNFTAELLSYWHESDSAVLCLLTYGDSGFFAGKADGTCVYHNTKNHHIRMRLTGPDCDPVYDISCDEANVYTACRDGGIRKYELSKRDVDHLGRKCIKYCSS